MHEAAYVYVQQAVADLHPPRRVLEIGSRDINGTVRPLFGADDYVGLDIAEGPGVDVVTDVREYKPRGKFDAVVCCEVLEHAPDPEGLLDAAFELLKKGGALIVTAAGPGREPHSAVDGAALRSGEHYENIAPTRLKAALKKWSKVTVDQSGTDVRAVAVK